MLNQDETDKAPKPDMFMSAICDGLSDPMIVIDAASDGVIYANKAASDLAAYCVGQGQPLTSPASWIGASLDVVLAQSTEAGNDQHCEARLEVAHFDRLFDINIQRSPDFGSDKYWVAIFRDYSVRAEADRTKKELVSTVSHELRSPLTAIKGAMGLVLSGAAGDLPEKAHQMITIAQRNAERLVLIINDILDLDKITDGAMVFDNADVELAVVVRDAVDALAGFKDRFDVEIDTCHLDKSLISHVDPNRIVQVLVNLLSNAIKFSPAGGQVSVKLVRNKAFNRLSVVDRGEGIPSADQAALFDRFVQVGAKNRAATGGTGLGLSIVKAIVESQGGVISFESELGCGTTFHVDLPVARNHDAKTDITQRSAT